MHQGSGIQNVSGRRLRQGELGASVGWGLLSLHTQASLV